MSEQVNIKIREFDVDKDLNFLYNSFLKSFRGALINKKVSNAIYYKNEQRILTEYIQSPGASILIACDPADENVIYGYLIYNLERNEIFWAYCKEAFRRLGIFKKLLIESKLNILKPIIYRHSTFGGEQVVAVLKDITFVYCPFYYTM